MHVFEGYRTEPPADYLTKGMAAPLDQPQFEGMVCEDGTVMVRWRTAYHSSAVFASWDDFAAVHGHPEYGTKIYWSDPAGWSTVNAPFFALHPVDRAAIEAQETRAAADTMTPDGE